MEQETMPDADTTGTLNFFCQKTSKIATLVVMNRYL